MATSTARQVIEDALHYIRILGEDDSMTDSQAARGLRVMNQMMHGFNTEGVQYVHSDLALTDTVNVPDEQVRNVALMLARAMSLEYGKTLGENLASEIVRAKGALQAFYYKVRPAKSEISLRPSTPDGYIPLDRL